MKDSQNFVSRGWVRDRDKVGLGWAKDARVAGHDVVIFALRDETGPTSWISGVCPRADFEQWYQDYRRDDLHRQHLRLNLACWRLLSKYARSASESRAKVLATRAFNLLNREWIRGLPNPRPFASLV